MSSQYSNDIIESEVILFTGAGASCPLGFEALEGLLSLVIAKIKRGVSWYHVSDALGLFKDDSLKPLLNLEEFLERLNILVAMRDFEEKYETSWFPAQPGLEEERPKQQAFFTSQFKSDLKAALELRKEILTTIRDHFKSSDLMEKVVDLYRPLFELLRREIGATAVPVFTTNYDLALEAFATRVAGDDYDMINGFKRVFDTNPTWDSSVYHDFSLRTPLTLVLFKLHGSVFWQRSGEQIVFNRQPTLEEIEDVLLYPMQTKTIVEDPFLTCYNYFEECLRNAKLMIAIGYSFGDDYLNQVIARCQLANPDLEIMVFNPGFKDHPGRQEKFDRQIGVLKRSKVHYDHFEIGEQGKGLLREVEKKVERKVQGLEGAQIVYQDELNFAELDRFGSWTQQDNDYVAEWSEGDEPKPVQLYLQSSSAINSVMDAVYEVQFTAQIYFSSGEPDDWHVGVWLYQRPGPTPLKYWLYITPRGVSVCKPHQTGPAELVYKADIQANRPHAVKVRIEYGVVHYSVDGKLAYKDYESDFKVQQIAIAAGASGRPFRVRISDLKIKWNVG